MTTLTLLTLASIGLAASGTWAVEASVGSVDAAKADGPTMLRIYPADPPVGDHAGEIEPGEKTQENGSPDHHDRMVADIKYPAVTLFRPDKPDKRRPAVIICPGGGYSSEWFDKEGFDVARAMNEHGITAFVLKYRLPTGKPPGEDALPLPQQDVFQAIRFVRAHAREFGIDPKNVGVMGFSAGGHLAASAATMFNDAKPAVLVEPAEDAKPGPAASDQSVASDQSDAPAKPAGSAGSAGSAEPDSSEASEASAASAASAALRAEYARIAREPARPDFAVLMYPVISMAPDVTHGGSRDALIGRDPSKELIERYSADSRVTRRTPPLLIIQAKDDTVVPFANATRMAEAAQKAGARAQLILYDRGQHGFGLGDPNGETGKWLESFISWAKKYRTLSAGG